MKSSSVKIAIKKTALVAIVTLSGMMVALLTIKKFSSLNQDVLLDDHHAVLLATLGDSALQHMDVPVASILLYNDTVIGAGYNTVVALGEAGGHAEINAISSALRSMGRERFDSLDRNNLMLVTTFEPCLMCRGAIVEYRIRNVVFLKQKSLMHWLAQYYRELRYEITKRHGEPESLQDSLFMKHPQYQLNTND